MTAPFSILFYVPGLSDRLHCSVTGDHNIRFSGNSILDGLSLNRGKRPSIWNTEIRSAETFFSSVPDTCLVFHSGRIQGENELICHNQIATCPKAVFRALNILGLLQWNRDSCAFQNLVLQRISKTKFPLMFPYFSCLLRRSLGPRLGHWQRNTFVEQLKNQDFQNQSWISIQVTSAA